MLELFDKKGAAEFLLMSPRKIDVMRQEGKLPFIKIGRQVRFKREALEDWVNGFEEIRLGNNNNNSNNNTEEK